MLPIDFLETGMISIHLLPATALRGAEPVYYLPGQFQAGHSAVVGPPPSNRSCLLLLTLPLLFLFWSRLLFSPRSVCLSFMVTKFIGQHFILAPALALAPSPALALGTHVARLLSSWQLVCFSFGPCPFPPLSRPVSDQPPTWEFNASTRSGRNEEDLAGKALKTNILEISYGHIFQVPLNGEIS